jgi:hypothetical protein
LQVNVPKLSVQIQLPIQGLGEHWLCVVQEMTPPEPPGTHAVTVTLDVNTTEQVGDPLQTVMFWPPMDHE